MTVAGLVLAAGGGSRMGLAKALVRLPNGQSLLTNAVRILNEGGITEIVVVIGAVEAHVRKALESAQQKYPRIFDGVNLTIVSNPRYGEGMGTSVQAGLAAAAELDPAPDAVVVQLADTPDISPDAVERVTRLAAPETLAVATYDGQIGHPMLLGRAHWDGIAKSATGDKGARGYLMSRDDVQTVVADGLGSPTDLDTPEQLEALGDRASVATEIVRAEVTPDDISVSLLELLVRDRRAGAVATFSGVVRDHDHGRMVQRLKYMAHPSADETIKQITAEVAEASGVRAIAVQHRVGELAIGDVALGCAVASDHRAEAFEVCSLLVERVKSELPVWKQQVFDDGTDEWVNAP